jgi:hypothetical protein
MVTPAQGSLGAGSPLEQLQTLRESTINEKSQVAAFILLATMVAVVFMGL